MSDLLTRLGLSSENNGAFCDGEMQTTGRVVQSINPATGEVIASVRLASADDYETIIGKTTEAFDRWRMLPAPKRGEIVRQMGDAMRKQKDDLGTLVSMDRE